MISNKAEANSTELIIKLVLGLLVLIVAIFAIYYLNSTGVINDIIPGFSKSYNSVKWSGGEILEHPELISYFIDGNGADIYFRYIKFEGNLILQWRNDEATENIRDEERSELLFDNIFSRTPILWINVNDKNNIYYNALNDKNREFVDKIINEAGSSPEKVLEIIVNRVRKNEEENKIFDVKLNVYFDNLKHENILKKEYSAGSLELRDFDGLIIKFNQITRGIVKAG